MNESWTTGQSPSQQGRRVVITGANSGLRFQTALELARHGAEGPDAKVFAEIIFPGPSLDLLINNAGVMAIPTRFFTSFRDFAF
jgi:NAD(P)-dependent dehydrogenase (short-subunit alcohol dehydrogenase family)